jgi:hypothetical protein
MRHTIAAQLKLKKLYGIRWDPVTKTKSRINIPLRKKPVSPIDREVHITVYNQQVTKAVNRVFGNEDDASHLYVLQTNRSANAPGAMNIFRGTPTEFRSFQTVMARMLARIPR